MLKRFPDWTVDQENAKLSSSSSTRGWDTLPAFTRWDEVLVAAVAWPRAHVAAVRVLSRLEDPMARITYIEFNGAQHVLEIAPGFSVMQCAVEINVRGIIAECGGTCSCATCHVYVDPAWLDRVGAKNATEEALLGEVCDAQPNSRLSCQIRATEELDGLVVRLPARQV